MEDRFFAHFEIKQSGKRAQTLKEHCTQVGKYASEALKNCGFSSCGKYAGLKHDGKAGSKYQKYLIRAAEWTAYKKGYVGKPDYPEPVRGSVIHTFQGCIHTLEKYHNGDYASKLTSEILACAIGSHHGLFDCRTLEGESGFDHRLTCDRKDIEYEESKRFFEKDLQEASDDFDHLFEDAKSEVIDFLRKLGKEVKEISIDPLQARNYINFEISMAVRMITSALIYADRRDTAEFSNDRSLPDNNPDWDNAISYFEKKYGEFKESRPIDKARKDFADQCAMFAEKKSGIYRQRGPTGVGKNLASLRYALHHAKKYGMKKIIYVNPLLTIIDQNGAEIRGFLPDGFVLEDHSDVVVENMTRREVSEYDLQKDQWNTPVVITTMARFLDVLFGAKTGDIAKMRAMSNAVIIIDEVQSVPYKMASLFTGALNFLADFCGSDILLSSATQPAFEKTEFPLHLTDNKEQVVLPPNEKKQFERYSYHLLSDGKDMTVEEIAEEAVKIAKPGEPLCVICNTKKEARDLYLLLKNSCPSDADIKHLSASMCKAHRKQVIKDIEGTLKKIQNGALNSVFILISTQLIEAGVNLSFRHMIRLEAGDDSLVQAAGRCNRGWEYGEKGDVYLAKVRGEEKSLRNLPDIQESKAALEDTIIIEKNDVFAPESEKFIDTYYSLLYSRLKEKGKTMYPFSYQSDTYLLGDLLGNSKAAPDDPYILAQPFFTGAQNFRVYDEDTYTVIVPYANGANLIRKMRDTYQSRGLIPGKLIKEASQYTVQIFEWQKNIMEKNGLLIDLCECDVRHSVQIFAALPEAYNKTFGLTEKRGEDGSCERQEGVS